MDKKKLVTATAVVALCVAVGIGGQLVGCAPQQNEDTKVQSQADAASESPSDTTTSVDSNSKKTMDQWGEDFPLQYQSYRQNTEKEDGSVHGHYILKAKLLAPVVREGTNLIKDADGSFAISGFDYDEESGKWVIHEDKLGAVAAQEFKQGCFSCKSSTFDEAYAKNGAEIFTIEMDDEFVDIINGQAWDCAICHGDTPGTPADATFEYWTQLSRDSFDKIDARERACGQCHNSLDYRSRVTDQDAMDGFSPYKYGFDLDSLYDAAVEDGIYSIDEDTGILLTCLDHPDVEFLQSSPMHELGVSCVDCHMPQMNDQASNTTFTSHNASGSPLASEESLEYCLTCHSSQGINTTAEMADMVKELQRETAEIENVLSDKFDTAYDLIKDANQKGGVDEKTLQEARDNYSKAEAYYHAVVGSGDAGVKVAHNPMATANYNAQTGKLLDNIIQTLS